MYCEKIKIEISLIFLYFQVKGCSVCASGLDGSGMCQPVHISTLQKINENKKDISV